MVYVWMTEYLINTAGFVYQESGILAYNITPDMVRIVNSCLIKFATVKQNIYTIILHSYLLHLDPKLIPCWTQHNFIQALCSTGIAYKMRPSLQKLQMLNLAKLPTYFFVRKWSRLIVHSSNTYSFTMPILTSWCSWILCRSSRLWSRYHLRWWTWLLWGR